MKAKTNAVLAIALASIVTLVGFANVRASPPSTRLSDGMPPLMMNYQGMLTDPATGEPVADGDYEIRFALYDSATEWGSLWTELQTVSVAQGLFTVLLGSEKPLSADHFTGITYLGVKVGIDPWLTPRQRVVSVAYAIHALDAVDSDTVDGQDASAFAAAGHTHDSRYWRLAGNAGTTPGTHFLGTTDDVAVEFHVNGARALRIEPHARGPNVIAGCSANNTAGAEGATIAGGGDPLYDQFNTASGYYATVGGGRANSADAEGATIGGGQDHTARGNNATVAGGLHNAATEIGSTIGGGSENSSSGNHATISGGSSGIASDWYTTVSGGTHNTADHLAATVGGGQYNTSGNLSATVAGGRENMASGECASVGGGYDNEAGGLYATIGGGITNSAAGERSTAGGGWSNAASGYIATISGGQHNSATEERTTIGGGADNTAEGSYATISGGHFNTSSGGRSAVGGGESNTSGGWYSTVAGGRHNVASGNSATVSGGYDNHATADYATIGGGARSDPFDDTSGNRVSDNYGTIGGGGNNQAGDDAGSTEDAMYATVGGGRGNTAGMSHASVGGGDANTASGQYATVPGGQSNRAQGDYSFAAGSQANALHDSAFVWSDSSSYVEYSSDADHQFRARASGGVYFHSNPFASTGVYLAPGGTSWQAASDQAIKENYTPADAQDVLRRLASLPISTWNLKSQDPSVRHIGPVAQDFYAAFGFGESETAINMEDSDGVALTGIQALYYRSQHQATRIEALEDENAGLRRRLDDLEALVTALAAEADGGAR